MFTRRRLIIGGIVLAGAAVLASLFLGGDGMTQETSAAEKTDVVQQVAVTGTVRPAAVVDLAFLKTGRVVGIYSDAGDTVVAGQIIAALAAGEEAAALASAKARLRAAEAKLEELERGSRPESLSVARAELASAEVAASEALTAFRNASRDAFTKADDAIRFKVDQFMSNTQTESPQLNFSVYNTQNEFDTEWQRLALEARMDTWETKLGTISSEEVRANVAAVRDFLDLAAKALNDSYTSGTVTAANIASWKADVAASRTTIAATLTTLASADEKVRTTASAVELARRKLELAEAGSDPTVVAAQRAAVDEAVAAVRNSEALIGKTVIRTPIAGVVSTMDLRLGEIVDAGRVVSGVLSRAAYEIEANIPEADIAKIAVGQGATVTLDAYGNDVEFAAKVTAIDPGETIIEGIPTYKTKLQFVEKDERIRSGMTANVEIHGEKKEGVLAVPSRAVIREDNRVFVRVLVGEGDAAELEERDVVIGLRGTNGFTEVVEGVQEGDQIVVFLRQ